VGVGPLFLFELSSPCTLIEFLYRCSVENDVPLLFVFLFLSHAPRQRLRQTPLRDSVLRADKHFGLWSSAYPAPDKILPPLQANRTSHYRGECP